MGWIVFASIIGGYCFGAAVCAYIYANDLRRMEERHARDMRDLKRLIEAAAFAILAQGPTPPHWPPVTDGDGRRVH